MTKQEFLEKLKLALGGKILPEQIEEHIHFYEDYINTEVRKGKSEEEVLASLGDPRLIARTIAETASGKSAYDGRQQENSGYGQNAGSDYSGEEQIDHVKKYELSKVPGWVWLVLVLLIVVVILSVVFSVISALLPVLLPILFVLLLVKVFRDWIH